MQDIHRKNAKKLTVNPPDMSNKSNLEDFPLILYEAANDECKFLCKLWNRLTDIDIPCKKKKYDTLGTLINFHLYPY